jgi:hypothetical protein
MHTYAQAMLAFIALKAMKEAANTKTPVAKAPSA